MRQASVLLSLEYHYIGLNTLKATEIIWYLSVASQETKRKRREWKFFTAADSQFAKVVCRSTHETTGKVTHRLGQGSGGLECLSDGK